MPPSPSEQNELYAQIMARLDALAEHEDGVVASRLKDIVEEVHEIRENVREAHRRLDRLSERLGEIEASIRSSFSAALRREELAWYQSKPWKHVIYVLLACFVLAMSQLKWINLGDVDTGLGWWDRITSGAGGMR